MATVAPYGTWTSPISGADLAAGEHPVAGGRFVGDEVWWLELRPAEGGRYAVRRSLLGGGDRGDGDRGVEATGDGTARDVLPAPWNARTRVHEYGGGAWTVTADGVLVFAEFTDQRLYRLDPGSAEPVALTPEPPRPAAWRYGELQLVGDEVWCVRERHAPDGTVARDLAAVPLDGSPDGSRIRSVVSGSHFLAAARVSPDGARLAWIAWEHPRMPWDGTELRVADLVDGVATGVSTLLGSATESVLQPQWWGESTLLALSDRSGFWNLHRVGLDGSVASVYPVAADVGGPLWTLGREWYARLDETRLLVVRTLGVDTLAVLDLGTGALQDVDLGEHTAVALGAVRDRRAVVVTGGARVASGVRLLDLDTWALADVRLGVDALPPAGYLPPARLMSFDGPSGRDVHTVVYEPHNAGFAAPPGELPPFVAFVHGGPTSLAYPALSLTVAYLTSRGIGVVDVNYGGSAGYGRAYRERLRGQWGVVDVEDTVAAVLGLASAGLADRARLAIRGGSAGGWTVLSALTGSDVFACGASYFGVAELVRFAADTHDFESRYLDGLIGPLPSARALYDRRAPVNNVDKLTCPVLLLQGEDDPIVPPSQAERFRDALVAKGLPYAYRLYPGESHGFRRATTIVDAAEAELSFYGQVMGFEPPGVPVIELS